MESGQLGQMCVLRFGSNIGGRGVLLLLQQQQLLLLLLVVVVVVVVVVVGVVGVGGLERLLGGPKLSSNPPGLFQNSAPSLANWGIPRMHFAIHFGKMTFRGSRAPAYPAWPTCLPFYMETYVFM